MGDWVKVKDYFKADLEKLRGKVQKCIIDTAKDVFNEVINQSPEPRGSKKGYSLGSYVLSHRVTFDGSTDMDVTLIKDVDLGAVAKARKRIGSITKAAVVIGQDVKINNEISYADEVEFIGWHWTGPYYTYGKAATLVYVRTAVRAAAV